jgi:4-amino-4-deoxy-L-arabinose transferase-like glycosyltransferase
MTSSLRNRIALRHFIWIALGAIYLAWLLATLHQVPFHPDEATWIYMSRDLDRALADGPATLCWRPESAGDPLQVERERACPLPRDLIGVSRLLTGRPATGADWNWSATWEENALNGALPSEELLFLARMPLALLLFLSVLLMARIGWRMGGTTGAIATTLLFGLNSQVLLHGRRDMSEAALLFGMILAVVLVLEAQAAFGRTRRRFVMPLLVGAALAIAISAKLSGLLVAPVAVVGILAFDEKRPFGAAILRAAGRLAVMTFSFLAVFLMLNPLYWCHPVDALAAVAGSRDYLLGDQLNTLRIAAPGQVLDSLGLRLAAVVYEPFLAPLSFWDIPNYAKTTAAAESAYLSNPLFSLTAGGLVPALWLILIVVGMAVGIANLAKPEFRGRSAILWVWFLGVLGGILLEIPILWQRYYLPLIPVLAVWGGVGVSVIIRRLVRSRPRPDKAD